MKIVPGTVGGRMVNGAGSPIAPGNLSTIAGGFFAGAGAPGVSVGYDPAGTLYTDLSAATAATINAIRTAFQVQRLLERDARGGTRYTEIIRSHFGVVSPDSRLQRPEYLAGYRDWETCKASRSLTVKACLSKWAITPWRQSLRVYITK